MIAPDGQASEDTMAAQKEKDDVANTSAAYKRMLPRWDKVEALLGGTETMRAAAREYLPQYESETDKNYKNRTKTAVLYNYTELTLSSLAGRPFAEEVVLVEPDTEFEAFAEDVDLQGSNLHRFCHTWFRDGLAKGFAHVLVEMPKVSAEYVNTDGSTRPRTLEDDRNENIRPYWCQIRPENLIFASSVIVNGKEELEHIRIKECEVKRDGFAEVEVHRVRVFERGYFEVWELTDKEWKKVENGPVALPMIPLVTFYAAKREGLMEVKPPLQDLADMNVRHWQSDSDQQNVLTVTRFPILAVSGVDDDAKIKIGPNQWLSTPDVQGKWYYVEHTGKAIEAGAADLAKMEERMASYGAEFLKKKPVAETASARVLDEAGAMSPLTAICRNFKDACEQALVYTAQWMKKDPEAAPSIDMKTEFEDEGFQATDTKDLMQLRTMRELSRPAFVSELKRRKFLSEDYDEVEDKQLIEDEAPGDADLAGMFAAAQKGLLGGPQPNPQDPANPGNVPPKQDPKQKQLPKE